MVQTGQAGTRRGVSLRVGVVVVTCTLLITASFVGILAVLSSDLRGVNGRFPWYLVTAAIVFVGTVIVLDDAGADGRSIIVTATFLTFSGFLLVSLSIEGVLFAVTHPGLVFVSQLVLYFFAAGLIATGLGYWGLNHWREFTETHSRI